MLIPRHSGYTPDGRRLYFKGGGGDPGADARAMEAERQGRITAATEQINSIFNNKVKGQRTAYKDFRGNEISEADYNAKIAQQTDTNQGGFFPFGQMFRPTSGLVDTWVDGDPANSRDNLYAEQKSAVYDLNSQEVNRQAEEAERGNRFGLARSGLAGGSADVDSVADINRRTNEGLLRAGGIADQSAADLRAADEGTRSNLISMAQSGIDTGSAATMALNGLKVNADSVAAQRSGSSVGSLFNDMSQAYLVNQQRQGMNTGMQPYGSQYFGVSNPRQGNSGTVQP